MNMPSQQSVAIAGVAESDLGVVTDKSVLQLHAQAAKRALDDAGLSHKDVDGIMSAGPFAYLQSLTVAEYLGITPTLTDSTNTGGSAFEVHVGHAAAAIRAGLAEVVLITYGSTQRSERARPGSAVTRSPYEGPFGYQMPITGYAMAMRRHMWEFGTTHEQFAEIAVSARKWAQLNPKAFKRDDLTLDEVMESPLIMDPLRKLDCCLITDGGGAVVVTSGERARDLKSKPVYVAGTAESHSHMNFLDHKDVTTTSAAITGPLALQRAGMTHADVDMLQTYDSFTYTVLTAVEDLGFCEKGEGGEFVSSGRIAPGGEFPLNTSGGGLSYCHPGMFGIFLLIEGVRQLRGEAGDRQVADTKTCMCNGMGGVLSAASTVVLTNEEV